ncbi:hypothetical protein RND71_035139 [Anisodus tanguticus]|uniref:Uncharacterized protein n=1 Tax=Anisodus tanguticus TaxID=243964 RepID=A0AAE1UU76_9SOLA|nr:hypothetical protein RND71_035139 [Anisodus tanguticus]
MPIHGKDLPDSVQDKKNEAYKSNLHHTKRYKMAEGIILNSFKDLKPGAIKAIHEKEPGNYKRKIYPVGPLILMDKISNNKADDESSQCLKWLDEQPCGSVLYISFGSGGTLSHEQLIELAIRVRNEWTKILVEQRTNVVMLSENIKVATRPKICDNGIIRRLEIAKVVEGLMEGEAGNGVRVRMKELKDAAAKVLNEDGSSTKALNELVSRWKKVSQD